MYTRLRCIAQAGGEGHALAQGPHHPTQRSGQRGDLVLALYWHLLVEIAAGNRRLFVVPDTITAFKRLAAKKRGEIAAEVTSAEPLSEKHVAELKAALKASLGKDVALDARVDPSLIGGLIVKVGSRMIDGSLRTKLNSLKLAMKEVG